MNNKIIDEARLYDRSSRPVDAYSKYHEAIQYGLAEIDDYINLSVIMFLFQDCGYAIEHNVSDNVANDSWLGMHEILGQAEEKFGEHEELSFWRRYFKLILLGEVSESDYCNIYMSKLKSLELPPSEKSRYINSLKSSL